MGKKSTYLNFVKHRFEHESWEDLTPKVKHTRTTETFDSKEGLEEKAALVMEPRKRIQRLH